MLQVGSRMVLSKGTKLGRYRITAPIGSGGMGEVYRARDTSLDRDVALKILPDNLDNERLQRFECEARVTAALNHPNIVVLHDIGRDRDVTYLITELLEGKTLRDALGTGAIPVRKAVKWAIQVAMGLAAAHDKGIIHRDLKPENVFITSDGRAKILDFGLAKLVHDATLLQTQHESGCEEMQTVDTPPGLILGSAGYMSPEQVRGDFVDHRSDIFSLGAIIYELLSGRRAFPGSKPVETLHAILNEEPAELPTEDPELSPSLKRVLARALAKDVRERFDSARDLAFVLEAITPNALVSYAPNTRAGSHPDVSQCTFTFTDEICRQLDRTTLDPRIINDHLHYADNCVGSDVMVCYLHGTGLDSSDFLKHLETADHRAVAPTLYGFERVGNRNIALSVTNHLLILREWLRHLIEHDDPIKGIVLVGFATGADLWLEYASKPIFDPAVPVTGLLTLDPNVSLETCWATKILAELPPDNPAEILDKLRSLSAETLSLNEWLNVQEYLARVFRKFGENIDVLTEFTSEIVQPFRGSGLEVFAARFREANAAIPYVRHVFSGTTSEVEAIAAIKLTNLDTEFLGTGYAAESFVIERNADHFDLLHPNRLKKHVNVLVAKCREHVQGAGKLKPTRMKRAGLC